MLTIDARWVNRSGMGTYLRHAIPGIIEAFSDRKICLLGNRSVLDGLGWLNRPHVSMVAVESDMYSLAEQWSVVRSVPAETELLFYPHYNIPLFYRGKMLVTVYDLCHTALPDAGLGVLKTSYASFFFERVRRKAAVVMTISDFTRNEFLRMTSPRDQPVIPIHLGVDQGWFEAAALRQQSGKDPYILYVGNVKPHKNLRGLVEAFRLLAPDFPHRLVIVGKREGLLNADTAVQDSAAALGDRIEFTGFVSDEKLKHWVANADLLVLPSFYEGFGLPPLEAMACGCPAAVSDIPVLREVCGDAAFYFDPHNPSSIAGQIGSLLASREARDRLTELGFRRAREFTWESCVQKTCDVVRDLLTKKHE